MRTIPALVVLALLCSAQVPGPAGGQPPDRPASRNNSSTPRKPAKKKRIWAGLALIGAGAVTFVTAGRSQNYPQQCALVPLVGFCVPARTVRTYNEAQQGIGVGLVAAGGVMVWSGLP